MPRGRDLSGEMPREKAVNASKKWVPMVHPGEWAPASGEEMAVAPIGEGVHMVHPGEWAPVSSAGEEIAVAPRGEAGMVHPGEWAPVSAEEMAVPPVVHPGEWAPVSAEEMAEPPVAHPGEWAPVSSAGEEIAVAPSGEAGMLHPGEWALVSGEEMAVPPVVHPGEWVPVSGQEMPFKKADASSSGGVLMVHPRSWVNFTALSGGSVEDCEESAEDCEDSADKHHGKKARRVCVIQLPEEHCTEDKADMGLSGGVLQKQISKVNADISLSGEMLHELPAREDDTSLSGEMLHEHPAKEADTSLSGEMLDQHDHPAEEADTSKDIKDSDPNEAVHVKKAELHIQDIHEAKLLIKELNQSGVGEDISDEEFLAYFKRLACKPPWIDLEAELTEEAFDQQYVDHALCRFRYYKHKLSQQVSKEELHGDNLLEEGEDDKEEGEYDTTSKEKHLLYIEEDGTTSEDDDNLMDKTEADCNLEFLEEKGFFISFEEDGTLDWFFHPDYCKCASLNDYQRLVLKNYGGTEYSMWSDYHSYLHSYDIEREYVKYCGELSKQLKWMEDYVDICRSSVKWGKISSRGAFQAIRIAATSFPKITPTLAYTGYGEYKENICYHHRWFKEYDDLYFEIWRRVTKGTSFREALEGVYKLNRFPVRQGLMQTALVNECIMTMISGGASVIVLIWPMLSIVARSATDDDGRGRMSAVLFHTCTAAIHHGVKEDKAKELIAVAVTKLVNMPKSYEDYITRKIQIAHIIKILPSERTEATV